MSFFLAFVGFAMLVVLHELGHFLAAKAVGMRVERFSLFFPPLIARYRPKGSETEYAIGAIPLGGYVKISGMSPVEELPPEVEHRAYYKQDVWRRIVTILAGPLVNIVLAFVLLWGYFAFEGKSSDRVAIEVFATQPGEPAAGVLREGDRILSVDGVKGYAPGLTETETIRRFDALRAQLNTHGCAGGSTRDGCKAATPARVLVLRGGERRTLSLTPEYDDDAKRMLAGFSFGDTSREDVGVGEAAELSVTGMWRVSRLTVENIIDLVHDEEARKEVSGVVGSYEATARKEVSGVVGSYEATRQTLEFDTARAIQILALISLSLGIINLFPFLPLDGGHIFWAVAEKLRGRRISYATMERASIVGIGLVVILFLLGFTNDVNRITSGEGFGVR